MEQASTPINCRKVLYILSAICVVLIGISSVVFLVRFYNPNFPVIFIDFFYLDKETNFSTYFSVMLLLMCAGLLYIIYTYSRAQSYSGWWLVLALGFVYLSLDEFISIHERLSKVMNDLIGKGPFNIFDFGWTIPASVVVFVLFLAILPFLKSLPAPTRRMFLIAAVIYLTGSILMELPGGWIYNWEGPKSRKYALVITIEESLEMFGLVYFVYALLTYITLTYRSFRIQLLPEKPTD
jgi:hypothetical protein